MGHPAAAGSSDEASTAPPPRSPWRPWRAVPGLLVLIAVLAVWATRFEVLRANNWAYPVTLVVVGVVALVVVLLALPRRGGVTGGS